MHKNELSISVGQLISVPRICIRGGMDGWHDQAVKGILEGFRDQGTSSIVLDLAAMSFAGADGAAGLIAALRSIGPEICIHVVASGAPSNILARAGLGPSVRLYSNTHELAQYLSAVEETLTSRWVPPTSGDEEMPLAA